MDKKTQTEIAYSILAITAIDYDGGDNNPKTVAFLKESYRIFTKDGNSPIASALLSQRAIKNGINSYLTVKKLENLVSLFSNSNENLIK